MNQNHLELILAAGHQAPSADNCQPWIFEIKESSVILHHDLKNTHANHIYNVDYFADHVSLGMVLENMSIQAEKLGYESEIKLFEETTAIFAEIFFKKTSIDNTSEILPILKKRKTNRRAYQKKNIDVQIRDLINQIAVQKGARMSWIDHPKKISALANTISSHDIILWEDQALRKNLIRMLRFGSKVHPDGLSLKSLELGIKRHLFRPSIVAAKIFPFIWKILGIGSLMHTKKNIRNSGNLVLMTIPKERKPGVYIQGGQIFQAIWLKLTKNNVAVQPLFGPLAFILNGQLKKGGLSEKHERIRQRIEEHFLKEFPHLSKETPVAFFRIGYAKKPSAVSGRKDIRLVTKNV